jgi:hypothetical protein
MMETAHKPTNACEECTAMTVKVRSLSDHVLAFRHSFWKRFLFLFSVKHAPQLIFLAHYEMAMI